MHEVFGRSGSPREGPTGPAISAVKVLGGVLTLDTKRLKDIAISEAGLIFDPSTGVIYTSNPVGVFVITHLRQGVSRNDLARIGIRLNMSLGTYMAWDRFGINIETGPPSPRKG